MRRRLKARHKRGAVLYLQTSPVICGGGLLQLRRLFVNNTRSYRVPFSSSQVNLLCLCSCYYPIPLSYPQENYNFILCVSFAVNINPISCEMTFPSD